MAEESKQPSETPATTPPPMANSPEARTLDGTLKDASQTTEISTTPSTKESTPDASKDDKAAIRAPQSYDFKAGEGGELDKAAIERVTPIFKELDLDNAQAQKLVDFYATLQKDTLENVRTMREGWVKQINSDPEMGGKLETIKADLGRMYTQLPPETVKEFKAAMDLTGAGDHPAFVKAFWKLSQMINEGKHVSGTSPSSAGQIKPGTPTKPSAAQSMYPNLPSAQ